MLDISDDIFDETKVHPGNSFNENFDPEIIKSLKISSMSKEARNTYYKKCRPLGSDTPFLHSAIYKIGKCVPFECSDEDVSHGGTNYLGMIYFQEVYFLE